MSELKERAVRIIIHERLFDEDDKNLFGTIIHARGKQKIIVKLTYPITGKMAASNILELRLQDESKTFKPLTPILLSYDKRLPHHR